MTGIFPSFVLAQAPSQPRIPSQVRVPAHPVFRLSPVEEDSSAIVRNPGMTVGNGPAKRGGPANAGLPNDANRIRVANSTNARPIAPANKAAPPAGKVAPVGFTVELMEPPGPETDGLETEEEVAEPVSGEYRAEVLPAAQFEEDEEEIPAAPPARRNPGRNGIPPRTQGNDEEGIYGIDRVPREPERMRPPGDIPDPNVKKCAEIYNDRDCCEEGEFCADQSHRVRSRALRTYTKDMLDITPRFQPDPNADETPEKYTERLSRALAKLDSRDWKDRNGNVVATGKFTDMRNGRVIIESTQGTQELIYLSLSNDDQCFVNAWWDLPNECQLGDDVFQSRQWTSSTFAWKASGLCHKPLYWEDINLERYGHTVGPVAQPIVSGAHFFGTIFVLPYKMGINPPGECQYALGYYRPGSCAPRYISPLPLSKRGAMLQATSVLGLIWLTP